MYNTAKQHCAPKFFRLSQHFSALQPRSSGPDATPSVLSPVFQVPVVAPTMSMLWNFPRATALCPLPLTFDLCQCKNVTNSQKYPYIYETALHTSCIHLPSLLPPAEGSVLPPPCLSRKRLQRYYISAPSLSVSFCFRLLSPNKSGFYCIFLQKVLVMSKLFYNFAADNKKERTDYECYCITECMGRFVGIQPLYGQ